MDAVRPQTNPLGLNSKLGKFLQCAVTVFFLTVVVRYNSQLERLPTTEQRAFDKVAASDRLPSLAVNMTVVKMGQVFGQFTLVPKEDHPSSDSDSVVVRLLELARDARLFDLKGDSLSPSRVDLEFRVDGKQFNRSLSAKEITADVRLQLLTRLLTEQADQVSSAPVVAAE